jgi:hypothetical protein
LSPFAAWLHGEIAFMGIAVILLPSLRDGEGNGFTFPFQSLVSRRMIDPRASDKKKTWQNYPAETHIILPNVPDDLPPLAFGIRGCSAAEMPKVPKAWWLGPSVCSHFCF